MTRKVIMHSLCCLQNNKNYPKLAIIINRYFSVIRFVLSYLLFMTQASMHENKKAFGFNTLTATVQLSLLLL